MTYEEGCAMIKERISQVDCSQGSGLTAFDHWLASTQRCIKSIVVECEDESLIIGLSPQSGDDLLSDDGFMDKIAWQHDDVRELECTCHTYVVGEGIPTPPKGVDLMILRLWEERVLECAQHVGQRRFTVLNPFYGQSKEEEDDGWESY